MKSEFLKAMHGVDSVAIGRTVAMARLLLDSPANIIVQGKTVGYYVDQIKKMKEQYDQLKGTYDSMNGLRNVGDLLNNQLLTQYIPKDYQGALGALRSGSSGGFDGISGSLMDIIRAHQARTCADTSTNIVARKSCEQDWQTLALQKNIGDMGYKQAATNIDNLQTFVNSIKTSTDPKSLQDLQARIGVEQVRMANEAIKLQTIAMMDEADRKLKQKAATDNFRSGLMTGAAGGFRY